MSNAHSIKLARSYRRHETPAERKLWACLRDRRFLGLKFRRQHPRGGYVVDFYCAERSLVVELDGAVHQNPEQIEYDRFRNEQFRQRGFTVLRVTNDGVTNTLDEVLAQIATSAGLTPNHHPSPHAPPSPHDPPPPVPLPPPLQEKAGARSAGPVPGRRAG